MIDIHCHILPGIDDGAKDLHTSLTMLEKAAQAGITDVIVTPHFIKDSKYNFGNHPKSQILDILRTAVQQANIDINIYLGNEIYLDLDILKLLDADRIATLADSRYLLIELPVLNEDTSAKDILFDIISSGYTPIIAHPERYHYFQAQPTKIQEYLDLGCLMQGDYQSLHGRYGRHAKKALTSYLKKGQIHFLASDQHHASEEYHIPETYQKLHKILGSADKARDLLENNPRHILTNKPLIVDASVPSKSRFTNPFSLPKFTFRGKMKVEP